MSEEKQVSIQEIAVSNMISIEAMVRILVKRGFITKEEIMQRADALDKLKQKSVLHVPPNQVEGMLQAVLIQM